MQAGISSSAASLFTVLHSRWRDPCHCKSLSELAGISSVILYDCGLLPRQGGTNTTSRVIPVAAVSIIRLLGPAPIQHGIAPIVKHRSLNASQK
jgi:hypothetical protein